MLIKNWARLRMMKKFFQEQAQKAKAGASKAKELAVKAKAKWTNFKFPRPKMPQLSKEKLQVTSECILSTAGGFAAGALLFGAITTPAIIVMGISLFALGGGTAHLAKRAARIEKQATAPKPAEAATVTAEPPPALPEKSLTSEFSGTVENKDAPAAEAPAPAPAAESKEQPKI